jgi:predicted Ser/Thr protein kinase/ActR/RegA family two-component response regulator
VDASPKHRRARGSHSPPVLAVEARPGRIRGLVVHDDVDLRLKLAQLLRKAASSFDSDTCSRHSFADMPVEQIRRYAAVFLVIEFTPRNATADPLVPVLRLRDQAPKLPVYVIARRGDERTAVRALKAGAAGYWPAHSVDVEDLREAIQPLVDAGGAAPSRVTDTEVTTGDFDASSSTTIAGYRLVKKIAQSNTATVYLAESSDFPAAVALKVQWIVDATAFSSQDRKRFVQECKLLSTLNHRSVADVYDYGVTDNCVYLALEYFPCGSLQDRMRNPLSESEAHEYTQQMAEALVVIHAAGIVHRDLKPSNWMLTRDNRLVLIDFGLARVQVSGTNITHCDLRIGTPYYMSPEQADGNEPDARSDLYSLGIIVFEMLTGRVPFTGKSIPELLEAHRAAPVPRLTGKLTRFQTIIDRLLGKEPADRFGSINEFIGALQSLRVESVEPPEPTAAQVRG